MRKLDDEELARAQLFVKEQFLKYEKAYKMLSVFVANDDKNEFFNLLDTLAENGWDAISLDAEEVLIAEELAKTVKII